MNRKAKKIFNIDRLLLLGVLIFQAIILYKYLSPKQDALSAKSQPTASAQVKNSMNEEMGYQSIPMRLPLPPGHNENEKISRSRENIDDLFDEMRRDMHRMMQRAHEDFAMIDRLMDIDDDWDNLIKSPSMDMKEYDNNYVIVLNIPGTNISDVAISLEDRLLTIKSHYEMRDSMGMSHQQHEKRILLPGPVEAEKIQKTLSNKGILTVVVPKENTREIE